MKQLVHVVGTPLSAPGLKIPGLPGLEGAAEVKADSGGDEVEDMGRMENMPCCAIPAVLGVELVRGIFLCLESLFLISLTEMEDACDRPSCPAFQSCGDGIISVGPIVTPFRG